MAELPDLDALAEVNFHTLSYIVVEYVALIHDDELPLYWKVPVTLKAAKFSPAKAVNVVLNTSSVTSDSKK